MLYVRASKITDLDSLKDALQNAIRLEHSTIPPYLAAYYTLSGTSPGVAKARSIIHDIVVEEMLHMRLACNILNAIGGAPRINDPGFVPTYPGPLPMGIGHEDGPNGLTVGIKRYSRDTVHDVFMEIEEPEKKIPIPVRSGMLMGAIAPVYQTIGEFYLAVGAEISRQGQAIFTGDPARQVPGAIEVRTVNDALDAIELIVTQGEGTPDSPLDLSKELAHYYRFAELYEQKEIVPDASSPSGFAFDPKKSILIDDVADVTAMVDNPQLIDLSGDWRAARLADECDAIYTKLLNSLHTTFNGQPSSLGDAIAIMFEFKNAAEELLQQQLTVGSAAGQYAGPRFRFVGP